MSQITPRAAIVAHEDGVFLNLRHADHIADWALGGGALKTLRVSPPDWWYDSPFNNVFEVETKKRETFFERGEAAHTLFLEGRETYEAVYGVIPTLKDYPDHIAGGHALREMCELYSLPKSGTNEDMEERLRKHAPAVKLLADRIREFNLSGKRALSRSDDYRIRILHQMAMKSNEELGVSEERMRLRDALTGGLAEVTVFWTEWFGDVPVRMRARFDRIKANIIVDLKTIAGWRHADFRGSLLDEAVEKGYVIQAVHYNVGRQKLREFVKAGKVFGGSKEERRILKEIAKAESWAWGWIFAKTTGFPSMRFIPIRDTEAHPRFVEARQQRDEAIANFVAYWTFHGGLEDRVWFDPDVVWEPEADEWYMAGAQR